MPDASAGADKAPSPISKPTVDEVVELFRDHLVGTPVPVRHERDKGSTGRWLQSLLGIAHDSGRLDLADGELKTVTVKVSSKKGADGTAVLTRTQETIAIGSLPTQVERLQSSECVGRLVGKLANVVIAEILALPDGSRIWGSIYRLDARRDNTLMYLLVLEINSLLNSLQLDAEFLGDLHTRSGSLLQVRTKDSGSYTPMKLGEVQVSEMRRAVYATSTFLRALEERFPKTVVHHFSLEEIAAVLDGEDGLAG
jgi:hypothetical protein